MPTMSDIESLSEQMSVDGKIDLKTFFVFMAREFRDAGSEEEKKKMVRDAFKVVFQKNGETSVPGKVLRLA